ncbi:hypothetical protein QFZ49_001355 [Streptomyces turgidiscabies]|uniref:Lipoprotein n=1 Tax=Streptomyces turgidiscabies TaxID=85558 RepID=A0ABU0RHI5_9ACTN|nr:hypothetical protein [Streptomyces turgidiscabies]
MRPTTGSSRTPRRRRVGTWSVASALLALAGTGCSSPGTSATPDPSGPATGVTATAPGPVAKAYSTALFSGQFDRAATFVRPTDRGILKVLFAGMSQSSVRADGLGIGAVHTKSTSGTVVLTGKMCSSGTVPKGATVSPHQNENCVENNKPNSTDPAFNVSVCKTSGKWYVCFPGFDKAAHPGATSK